MKFLRTKHIVELTGLSRMTIYRMERDGRFPARRQLGANSVAWLEEDVAAWVSARPAVGPKPRTALPVRAPNRQASPRPAALRRTPRGEQISLPLDKSATLASTDGTGERA